MDLETQATDAVRVRPTSATVISWFWILIGVATLVSSIESYFKLRKFRALRPNDVESTDAQLMLDRFESLIGGTTIELLLGAIFACVCIVGAVGLLKLRLWGRVVLIALSWVSLVTVVVGIPLLVWEMKDLAFPQKARFSVFEVFFWIIGFLQFVFGIAIFGKMLHSLHGQVIRTAVLPDKTDV